MPDDGGGAARTCRRAGRSHSIRIGPESVPDAYIVDNPGSRQPAGVPLLRRPGDLLTRVMVPSSGASEGRDRLGCAVQVRLGVVDVDGESDPRSADRRPDAGGP